MQQKAFAERFLEHLDKIDPAEVESFILRTVAQRDFYARIFETLNEGVVTVDGSFAVTLVNMAARRVLRWSSRRRAAGEPLLSLLEDGPLSALARAFIEDPRQAQNEEIVLRWQSKRIYSVHFLPIFDPEDGDKLQGAAMILQDLTSARERQARTAQAEKIASLMTLTAGVAHEIKNPLNSLSIHAQLLERAVADISDSRRGASPQTERVAHSCSVIREEVERLRKCVDDFIDAARPSQPNFALQNINHLVEAVVRMTVLEFEEKNIEAEIALDPEAPPLPLDDRQMQQALRNLVRNAIEAIDAARRPAGERRIGLRTRALAESVVLEVSDTGIGIPQDDLPKIFEPYYTTKFNGSGLGLMAVGRIIREHGGFVTVTSAENEGTTFTIELPALNPRIKLLEGKII